MTTNLLNANGLHLINHVDDLTGASVGMYCGADCAPIEWAELVGRPAVIHNATGDWPCTECGHRRTGQVPGCTCQGCDS